MTQRSENYTLLLKRLFKGEHNELKAILQSLGRRIDNSYITNCARLSSEIISRGYPEWLRSLNYHGVLTRDLLDEFINNIGRNRQQQADDEMFKRLREDNERLRQENRRLQESNDRQRIELIEERHSLREAVESLMNIPASETPMSKSHEERRKRRHDEMYEVTNGLLDGDISYEHKEMVDYIKKHGHRFLDGEGCIQLFEPENDELFRQSLYVSSRHGKGKHRVSYTPNQKTMEKEGLAKLYYINRLDNVNEILTYLDEIFQAESPNIFKISCDFGHIIQKQESDDVTYEVKHPMDFDSGKSIPFKIRNQKDLNTYKHYIHSYIGEKMEQTHENSRNRFVAIHSFMFKVFPITREGLDFEIDEENARIGICQRSIPYFVKSKNIYDSANVLTSKEEYSDVS